MPPPTPRPGPMDPPAWLKLGGLPPRAPTPPPGPHPPCPGPMDRRAWLKLGGLALGALTPAPGPNLAGLLAAGRRAVSDDFSVILFWANGGPSHLDLFDLKPDAPAEIRGPFRPIKT